MLITVHNKCGDCFHINPEHIVMISAELDLEQARADFKDAVRQGLNLADVLRIPPKTGEYDVFLLGLDSPLVLPEAQIARLVEEANRPAANRIDWSRN